MGPLHNISLEVGMDANSENNYLAPAKRDAVAGLQFAFDLPYKGYFDVAPLAYKEINHNAFDQCGTIFAGGPLPGSHLFQRRQYRIQDHLGGRNQLLHGPGLHA